MTTWYYAMASLEDAANVARVLFSDEISDGRDCKAEVGRVGLPCQACAYRNEQWQQRIKDVQRALTIAGVGR